MEVKFIINAEILSANHYEMTKLIEKYIAGFVDKINSDAKCEAIDLAISNRMFNFDISRFLVNGVMPDTLCICSYKKVEEE